MSEVIARVGETYRLGKATAFVLILGGIVGLAVIVASATRLGMLPLAVALAIGGVMAVAGLRWPLVALAVFVALIPIEQLVVIDGFGTISRLAGIVFAVSYGLPRVGRLHLSLMSPAGWAFLAWAIVSLGWAIDPATSWGELQTLVQLFLIAFLVADLVAERPAIVRSILWVYSISTGATAFIAILSFVAAGASPDTRAAAIQDQNPAQFAAVLLPAFVFGLYEMLEGKQRMAGAAIALVTTIAIVVSGTRGAWVAMAVVVALMVFPRLQLRRKVALLATLFVIGTLTLQVPGVSNLVFERAATAVTTGGAGRTDIWQVGVSIYGSAPVLGVGYANFPVAYTSAAVRASDVLNGHGLQRAPHNIVIGTMTELGPIGLLLLALFVLPLVLRSGWGPDAAIVQAGLASLMTLALFLDIVGNRKQVWLLIGLAAGLAYVQRSIRSRRAPGDLTTPQPEAGSWTGDPAGASLLARMDPSDRPV